MTFARDLANFADVSAQNLTFRNKIINGDFGVWQRGTSFTDPNNAYTTDRWRFLFNGTGSRTVSRQTFTPGTAPVSGYEAAYYCSVNQTTAGSSGTYQVLDTTIEDVRTLAGQTFTVSFWAKANAAQTITASMNQNFGSGGSTEVTGIGSTSFNLTTSWARYTFTGTMTSIAGKTIGTGSYAFLRLSLPLNATFTIDLWGVQVEAGSSASAFETRPSQTELALCQRYYQKSGVMAMGCESVNLFDQRYPMTFPVTMRIAPTMAVHTVTYTLTTNLRTGTITTSNFTFYFNKAGSSGTLQDTSVNGGYEASAEL